MRFVIREGRQSTCGQTCFPVVTEARVACASLMIHVFTVSNLISLFCLGVLLMLLLPLFYIFFHSFQVHQKLWFTNDETLQ